jgi:Protein of unknown function (DUF664)
VTLGDLLTDAFGRVQEVVHETVEGLTPAELSLCPDDTSNSIAWLVWHLTRIQDDHISEVAGREQVWIAGGWAERFGLPFDPAETGYGQSPEEVRAVKVGAESLLGYHDAVFEQTSSYVKDLSVADLDEVVDERWDPPVTLGVRMVSIISDDLQHAGQAAYIKGFAERRRSRRRRLPAT